MDLKIPLLYILSRDCPDDSVDLVRRVLGITPIYCTMVSNILDYELARKFDQQLVRTNSQEDSISKAIEIAKEVKMPVLVIGSAGMLDAIYEDGNKEEIIIHGTRDNQVQ